ncbi:MAG: undecaprenyl-diphosphate phosphatase [archaeon]
MDLIQAIVLGLMQGITEWLPISSQGQVMVGAVQLFGIQPETALSYSILLHAGTLISAIIYFRKEIIELIKLREKQLLKFLFVAVLATTITAIPSYLMLRSVVGSSFALMIVVGLMLIITGILQKLNKKVIKAKLSNKNALFLGLGQGFSVLPGVSRSGITSSVLLFEGFKAEKAFKLSFLLSIPSVLVAELLFGFAEGIVWEFNLLIAIVIAAVVGLITINLLIKLARKINFSYFCIGFGVLYLILAFI